MDPTWTSVLLGFGLLTGVGALFACLLRLVLSGRARNISAAIIAGCLASIVAPFPMSEDFRLDGLALWNESIARSSFVHNREASQQLGIELDALRNAGVSEEAIHEHRVQWWEMREAQADEPVTAQRTRYNAALRGFLLALGVAGIVGISSLAVSMILRHHGARRIASEWVHFGVATPMTAWGCAWLMTRFDDVDDAGSLIPWFGITAMLIISLACVREPTVREEPTQNGSTDS